jgi:hypothetical protein
MKPSTPSPRPAKKLPKARVAFLHQTFGDDDVFVAKKPYKTARGIHCVIVERATPAEARAFARFFSLSEGERVEAVAMALFQLELAGHSWEQWKAGPMGEECRKQARAVLALLAGERGRK